MTRDARKVERKKSGQKKARKNFTVRRSLLPLRWPLCANARAPRLAVGEAPAGLASSGSVVCGLNLQMALCPLRRMTHRQT